MTERTFKQLGQGYGSAPANITVVLDGVTIFSGDAPTVDEPGPAYPIVNASDFGSELYTWTKDAAFQGSQSLSISVSGSALLLTNSLANYVGIDDPANPGNIISGGATLFSGYSYQTIDGVTYSNQLTNVEIDGIPQDQTPNPDSPGESFWMIPAGSVLTAVVNIQAGVV